MIKDRHLSRLLRAYPEQAKSQLGRVPPMEGATDVEAVLTRFREATEHPIGKAIALAVMLDQDESGEHHMDSATRQRVTQLFEEVFTELASSSGSRKAQ